MVSSIQTVSAVKSGASSRSAMLGLQRLPQVGQTDGVTFRCTSSPKFGALQSAPAPPSRKWSFTKHLCVWGGLSLMVASALLGVATLGLAAPLVLVGLGIGLAATLVGLLIRRQKTDQVGQKPVQPNLMPYTWKRHVASHELGHAILYNASESIKPFFITIEKTDPSTNADGYVNSFYKATDTPYRLLSPAMVSQSMTVDRKMVFQQIVSAFAGELAARKIFRQILSHSDEDILNAKPGEMLGDKNSIETKLEAMAQYQQTWEKMFDVPGIPSIKGLRDKAFHTAKKAIDAIPGDAFKTLIDELEAKKMIGYNSVNELFNRNSKWEAGYQEVKAFLEKMIPAPAWVNLRKIVADDSQFLEIKENDVLPRRDSKAA